MSDSPERSYFPPYHCKDCGSNVGFRSRRRNLAERYLLPLLLMQPVRCSECFRRDYRSIFTTVRERLPHVPKIGPGKHTAAPNRHVA